MSLGAEKMFCQCLICWILVLCASIGIYYARLLFFEDEGEYFLIHVNSTQFVFEADKRFLSVALDTSFMRCLSQKFNEQDWEKLEELSRFLAPAYLRLGGTEADRAIFTLNTLNETDAFINTTCEDFLPDGNLTINGEDWLRLNKFAQNANLSLIIDLNVLLRKNSKWDSSNAKSLIQFSEKNGLSLDFQLGNEPNSFPHVFNTTLRGAQLAKDFLDLREILNASKAYRTSKLIGPDVTKPKGVRSPSLNYLKEFLSNGQDVVDVVSWHQYYLDGKSATLEDFISLKTLKLLLPQIESVSEIVKKYSPSKPIWISETSSANGGGAPKLSNRFAATFLWVDKLGLAARHNISVVVRQSLFKDHYALISEEFQPNPDFWISVLYKQLVGTRVLDVKVIQMESEKPVRFYGHCIAADSPVNGSIVLFGINLSNETAAFILSGVKVVNPVYAYIFRPEFQHLRKRTITLNDKILKYNSTVARNLSQMAEEVQFPLTLHSYSIGFWVLTDNDVTICRR